MGGVKQEREGVKGESGYLGAGVGWGCLGRKLRSFEQNLRAERPSRSLKSALVSFLLPGTVLGGRGDGWSCPVGKGKRSQFLTNKRPCLTFTCFLGPEGEKVCP